MSSRSFIKPDMDRLYTASNVQNFNRKIQNIIQVMRTNTNLTSFADIETGFRDKRFVRLFGDDVDVLENVLSRLNIPKTQWDRIVEFSRKWATIVDSRSPTQPLLQSFMKDFSWFVNCKIQSHPKHNKSLWDFELYFPDIHLNFFDKKIHMIVASESPAGPNEFNQIKEIIRYNNATSGVTLVLVIGDGKTLRNLAKAASIEIVVFDESDCKSILMSSNSRQMFCRRVASRVSVEALQPYQTRGKVRSRMFYGRHNELKRLKNNLSSSFAIYGGRRVGKSSFLHNWTQGKNEFMLTTE